MSIPQGQRGRTRIKQLRYKPRQDLKGQGHYGKVKSRSHHNPDQCPYQVSTSYTLWFPRYGPDKILNV